MIQPGKIFVILCITCLSSFNAFTQQFNFTARLAAVDSTGFYRITVSPHLSAYIKTDLSDIRIADKKGQWVPHILHPVKTNFIEHLFAAFPILQNTVTDSGKNLLVFENIQNGVVDSLVLLLKNSAVSRTAILSGSNNRQDWYIIDDNVAISRSYETDKDEYLQGIRFPPAKYRYLKIVIDNMANDPLLVTKVGFYAQPGDKKPTAYQDNPAPEFTQTDSNKHSYIKVMQDNHYPFDKISLRLSGSKYYNREVVICFPAFRKDHSAKPGRIMGNFTLRAGLPATFELPRTNTALFFIVIHNADNPPLKIENIVTQQQTTSLVTYLEEGMEYNLLLGDSLALSPDYDLQMFKDSITRIRPLQYGALHTTKKNVVRVTTGNKNRWIWPSVIAAILVLSFLTFHLVADINKATK